MEEKIAGDSESSNLRLSVPTDGVRDSVATSGIRDSYLSYSTGVPDSLVSEDDDVKPLDKAAAQQRDANTQKWYQRRKFWAVCGIANIILTVIMVPVIIFGIFPKVAQNAINKSQLTYNRVFLQDPITEDSFHLTIKGDLINAGSFDAETSFPGPVQVYWNGALLGEVSLSPVKITGGKGQISVDDTFTIKDPAKFAEFAAYQMTGNSFAWSIQGKVKVKAMGITKSGLLFEKTITLPGGNGFPDTRISKITPNFSNPGQFTLDYEGSLFNPSPIGMHLGHTVLNIFYGDSFIGPAEVKDLLLVPGNNTLRMSGSAVPQSVTNVGGLVLLLTKIMEGQQVTTLAQGVYAEPGGKNISWVNTAVSSLQVSPVINVGAILASEFLPLNRMNLIHSESTATIHTDDPDADYQLHFTVPTQYSTPPSSRRALVRRDGSPSVDTLINGGIQAFTTLADFISLLVKSDVFNTHGSLLDVITEGIKGFVQKTIDGSTLTVSETDISNIRADSFTTHMSGAIKNTGPVPAKLNFPSGLKVSFEKKSLGVLKLKPLFVDPAGTKIDDDADFSISDIKEFTEFSGFMLNEDKFTWDLFADDVVLEVLGIPITGLTMKKSIELNGFAGLKKVKIETFEIEGPSKGAGVLVALKNSIVNPADIGLNLGDVSFNVFSNKVFFGIANATNFKLPAKKTIEVQMDGDIEETKENAKGIALMFTAFLAGLPIPLTVQGLTVSPPGADGPVPWLEIPFKELALNLVLKEKPFELIKKIDVTLNKDLSVTSAIDLVNPIKAEIDLLSLKSESFSNGTSIGTTDQTFKTPFVIPASGESTLKVPITPNPTVPPPTKPTSFKSDIVSTIGLAIGKLQTIVGYNQTGIDTTFTP